jgi:hypothetical protein
VEEERLHALLENCQHLPRIGRAREGRATEFLPGFACLPALLAQLFVHRALRLRLARLGVEEHPALRHSPLGRGQDLLNQSA